MDETIEHGIVTKLLGPDALPLAPEVARYFLSLSFTQADFDKMEELSEKANEGTLTNAEKHELLTLIVLNDLVQIMQVRAERTLKGQTSAA